MPQNFSDLPIYSIRNIDFQKIGIRDIDFREIEFGILVGYPFPNSYNAI